mmetsp:Transcript_1904/g.6972  ORF Transcript_1904/g.6972 Transcript_1904/m.6972 type:complete len:295 (+) Transcript_1904:1318-2202(+)
MHSAHGGEMCGGVAEEAFAGAEAFDGGARLERSPDPLLPLFVVPFRAEDVPREAEAIRLAALRFAQECGGRGGVVVVSGSGGCCYRLPRAPLRRALVRALLKGDWEDLRAQPRAAVVGTRRRSLSGCSARLLAHVCGAEILEQLHGSQQRSRWDIDECVAFENVPPLSEEHGVRLVHDAHATYGANVALFRQAVSGEEADELRGPPVLAQVVKQCARRGGDGELDHVGWHDVGVRVEHQWERELAEWQPSGVELRIVRERWLCARARSPPHVRSSPPQTERPRRPACASARAHR